MNRENFLKKITTDATINYKEKIKEIAKVFNTSIRKARIIYSDALKKYKLPRVPENIIKEIYKDQYLEKSQKIKIISKKYNIPRATIYDWFKKIEKENQKIEIKEQKKEKKKTKKNIIITCCQNNTPIYVKFYNNLISYASKINAELYVIGLRYHNPTSILSFENKQEKYDTLISDFLIEDTIITNEIKIYGDLKTQLTAVNPIFSIYPENANIIVGHPKLFYQRNDKYAVLTTGCVSLKNYINSRIGKISEKYHKFGFVLIDENNKIRQIEADNEGNFYDFTNHVENTIIKETNFVSAIVLGDLHAIHIDETSHIKNIELIKRLKPEYVILHDVFDGFSINHHQLNNIFYKYEIYSKKITLKEEIEITLEKLNDIYKVSKNIVLPYSNHDDFIKKWLIKQNVLNEIMNIKDYLKFFEILVDNYFNNINFIHEIIKSKFKNKFIYLKKGESFIINGYEVGFHGDSLFDIKTNHPTNYKKIREKIIVGHFHTPLRANDIISVGTTSKRIMYYNTSITSTSTYASCIIYNNGTAQLITDL